MWANLAAADSALAVTPNDGTDIQPTRGVWVGGYATGTTATAIVALL